MSDARLIDVRDACVPRVALVWSPAAPDSVSSQWELPTELSGEGNNDLLLAGRQVWIFGDSYRRVEPASRGEYLNEYTVRVVVAERFTDAGPVPKAWIDERVNFVARVIVNGLDFAIDAAESGAGPQGLLLGTLWTESIDVVEACVLELLPQDKLFFSETIFGFREVAS